MDRSEGPTGPDPNSTRIMTAEIASDPPRLPIDGRALDRAARVIKVLGHPLRLRLIEALEGGERHVGELQEAVDAGQALVSQQLAILRAHGVVDARRDGPRVYYRIVEPRVIKILDCIRECDLPELAEIGTLVPLGELVHLPDLGRRLASAPPGVGHRQVPERQAT